MPEMEYDDEDELMIILDDVEMQKSGRNEAEPELEVLKSRSQSRERPGSRGSQTSQSSRCNEKSDSKGCRAQHVACFLCRVQLGTVQTYHNFAFPNPNENTEIMAE